MNIHISDEQIAQMQVDDYKKLIKKNVNDTAFNELQQLKETHSKVRDNYYSDLQHIQPYFTNRKLSFRQISMMFSLRSKTIRNIRCNFPKMFSSLLCPLCKSCEDTQEHVLLCNVIQNILPLSSQIEYDHMRGTAEQQTDFLQV